MHTLLSGLGIVLVMLLASVLLECLLHGLTPWSERRRLHLFTLTLPLISVMVFFGALVHIRSVNTLSCGPRWDHQLDLAVLLVMGSPLLGALLLGSLRLLLMKQQMQQKELLADASLQARVDEWTQRQQVGLVRVRLARDNHPLALLYGVRQPTVLLSTWMLEHLDEAELEAVLMHEVLHAKQRDYVVNWVALMLRDAFFYLPTSRKAYRHFRQDKELACDDHVVAVTHRPLALASALTKVWLHWVEPPSTAAIPLVQNLLGGQEPVTSRIERLLSAQPQASSRHALRSFQVQAVSVGVMLLVLGVGVALMLAQVHCWPGVVLWQLF